MYRHFLRPLHLRHFHKFSKRILIGKSLVAAYSSAKETHRACELFGTWQLTPDLPFPTLDSCRSLSPPSRKCNFRRWRPTKARPPMNLPAKSSAADWPPSLTSSLPSKLARMLLSVATLSNNLQSGRKSKQSYSHDLQKINESTLDDPCRPRPDAHHTLHTSRQSNRRQKSCKDYLRRRQCTGRILPTRTSRAHSRYTRISLS